MDNNVLVTTDQVKLCRHNICASSILCSESGKVCLSYIYSFSDDMSSVKLPVDFVGQEVGMGFAWKNTISSFSTDLNAKEDFLRGYDMIDSFYEEILNLNVRQLLKFDNKTKISHNLKDSKLTNQGHQLWPNLRLMLQVFLASQDALEVMYVSQ